MSGSGASNYGYGEITPNSNVNGNFVNVDGSTYAGGFGSNVIPTSIHSCQQPPSNIVAASGSWVGNGGGRKNISRIYKSMKAGRRKSTRAKSLKRFSKTGKHRMRLKKSRKTGGKRRTKTRKSRRGGKSRRARKSRRTTKTIRLKSRRMRGGMGYTQYQSNVPFTPGYAVAGVNVAPAMSATSNPPPYEAYNHCQDNYNHYNATQGK